jgi:hypothetical protein
MTELSNSPELEDFGDLNALWQEGGNVPVAPLIDRLKQQNQKLRRLNQISFVMCIGALIITAALEFIGRIPTNGLLTLISGLAVLASWWKYRRDKAKLIAAYSEEPAKLLPFLIKRTKAARNLGRYYYACALPSVLLGILWARFTDDGSNGEADPIILIPLVVVGLICLVAVTVFGARLARKKTEELNELQGMLEPH